MLHSFLAFLLFDCVCWATCFQSEYDDNRMDPHHGEEERQDEPENLDLPEDLELDQDEEGEEEDNAGTVTRCIVKSIVFVTVTVSVS